jgi:Trk K+ transport system NAD-binding subunit
MPAMHLDQLDLPSARWAEPRFRLWREWCFIRMAIRQMWWRFALMMVILAGGGLLFQHFDPEQDLSLAQAMFYSWSLIFGEPPEAFPQVMVLRAMFFIMPVLGLTVILEGILYFAGLVRDRRRYERNWCVIMATSMSNHIVLVGLGRLGWQAFRLLRRLGESVVVIESDERNPLLDDVRRDGSPLIIGDGRNETLLAEANAADARAVIAATDNDLANLEVALDARQLRPDIRVVVRMFDPKLADKVRGGLDIQIAISQSAIAAPAFAMAAVDESIVSSFVVGNRLVVMQRWTVQSDGPLVGRTVAEVMTDMSCAVVELRSGAASPRLFPPPDVELQPGDELLVQGPFETLSELRERTGLLGRPPVILPRS